MVSYYPYPGKYKAGIPLPLVSACFIKREAAALTENTVASIRIVSKSRCFFGGEKGIRTLDTVPRIHDFQSCALDQLSHLSASAAILHYSRAFCKTFFSPAVIRRTSGSWRAFNRHGAPAHDFAGGKTGSARHGA